MAIEPGSNLKPKGDFQIADASDIKGAPQNKATKAELDAVKAYLREPGQIGKVTGDPTAANNGSYTMSAALAWVKDTTTTQPTTQEGWRWYQVPGLSFTPLSENTGTRVKVTTGAVTNGTTTVGTPPEEAGFDVLNCAAGNWRDELFSLRINAPVAPATTPTFTILRHPGAEVPRGQVKEEPALPPGHLEIRRIQVSDGTNGETVTENPTGTPLYAADLVHILGSSKVLPVSQYGLNQVITADRTRLDALELTTAGSASVSGNYTIIADKKKRLVITMGGDTTFSLSTSSSKAGAVVRLKILANQYFPTFSGMARVSGVYVYGKDNYVDIVYDGATEITYEIYQLAD